MPPSTCFNDYLSVIVLVVLGLGVDDTLTRLNGLKQVLALAVNLAATMWFVGTGQVLWPAAAVMAVGALVGGCWEEKWPTGCLRSCCVWWGWQWRSSIW